MREIFSLVEPVSGVSFSQPELEGVKVFLGLEDEGLDSVEVVVRKDPEAALKKGHLQRASSSWQTGSNEVSSRRRGEKEGFIERSAIRCVGV